MEYVIKKEEAGTRIDKWVFEKENELSRTMIQKLIEKEKILVNGKPTKSAYKIEKNDKIEIKKMELENLEIEPEQIDLNVIYEDDNMIIINKQKGLVVHPGNGNYSGTLVNAVMAKCKDSLSGIGGKIRPGIVHRLDKDTSGAIIVAKNDKTHIALSEQIKNREVKKTYIALVRGDIKEKEATINMPIARSKNVRTKMTVDKNGKEAITHFKVLKRYGKYTLLEINIETGRTHQIRVHLSQIGYPVVGDYIYSNGKNPFQIEGQMLHAMKLEFKHPITCKEMKIKAELPEYFSNILKKLEKEQTNGTN